MLTFVGKLIKVLTVLSGVLFSTQKRPKNDHCWVIFWIVGTAVVGDYKKSVSRASQASMSLESLIQDADYGETMAGNS